MQGTAIERGLSVVLERLINAGGRCRWAMGPLLLLGLSAVGCNQFASTATNVDGVRFYQRGDYQSARDRFTEALALNPRDANGYYNLAATHHRLGKLSGQEAELKQAENLYNQCLDRDPEHVACYRGLAVLLVDTHRPDAALRLLEGWSTRSPISPEPRIELARLYQELGNREKATRYLEEALTLDPKNARALTALGQLREQEGDVQQALANYQRSLAVNRFQPHVLARVAALQASVGGAVVPTTRPGETRLVEQPPQLNRY